MDERRRIVSIAAVLALALFAAAGWVVGTPRSDSDDIDPADPRVLAAAVRASAAIRATIDEGEPRGAQNAVVEAIAALSGGVPSSGWTDLDVLFIAALGQVQQAQERADGQSAAAGRGGLPELADQIDRTIESLVAPPARGRSTPWLRLIVPAVIAFALGTGVLGLLGLHRRVVPATGREDAPVRHDVTLPASLVSSPAGGGMPLPSGALDAARFATVLARERARCTRYQHDLSLVLLEIDQHETLARNHGETGRNYVVSSIADIAMDSTRASDIVAVLPEHRIAVLAPETSCAQAELLAEKLRRNVAIFPFDDNISANVSTRALDALGNLPEL